MSWRPPANVSLEEAAVVLLLRSPRLSVSRILDLLDLSDAEFRAMCGRNGRIAELLEARRSGALADAEEQEDFATCSGCGEWFVPYGGSRCCSDVCRNISRLHRDARR